MVAATPQQQHLMASFSPPPPPPIRRIDIKRNREKRWAKTLGWKKLSVRLDGLTPYTGQTVQGSLESLIFIFAAALSSLPTAVAVTIKAVRSACTRFNLSRFHPLLLPPAIHLYRRHTLLLLTALCWYTSLFSLLWGDGGRLERAERIGTAAKSERRKPSWESAISLSLSLSSFWYRPFEWWKSPSTASEPRKRFPGLLSFYWTHLLLSYIYIFISSSLPIFNSLL